MASPNMGSVMLCRAAIHRETILAVHLRIPNGIPESYQ